MQFFRDELLGGADLGNGFLLFLFPEVIELPGYFIRVLYVGEVGLYEPLDELLFTPELGFA